MFCLLTIWLTITAATFSDAIEEQANNAFKTGFTWKPLRVLGFFPYNGYSHYVIFKSLMSEMAKRGHQVTVVSPFAPAKPQANFSHVDLSDIFPEKINEWTLEYMANNQKNENVLSMMNILAKLSGAQLCRDVFSHRNVKRIISGKNQYDVIFTEIFGADCFLAIGHVLQIPTISISSSYAFPWTPDYVGDIDNPSFIRNFYIEPSPLHLSTFASRLRNTLMYVKSKVAYYFYITRPAESVMREFLGEDIPSLSELRNNVSLVMVNAHESILSAKPTVPRILPIGGMHIRQPNPKNIPQDIHAWLDAATSGLVYFSLGSLLQAETLPTTMMEALLDAFKKLAPLRILWKFESKQAEIRDKMPQNVKTAAWLPQMEILSHPNTKAFFTHGGLMGLMEAVYNGVPMIGMPVYADQLENTFRAQELGIALSLNHANITKEKIIDAITKATTDHSIRQRAKEVSQLFRDRPMTPLDSAIWWTEYVVRHGGAHHLESPTAKMPLWQYVLLDVAAFLVISALVVTALLAVSISYTLRFLMKRTFKNNTTDKKRI